MRDDTPNTPPIVSESLDVERAQQRSGGNAAGALLGNFLAVLNGVGEDAEREYEAARDDIRKRAPEVLVEIARAEQACDERDYPTRWGLAFAASELRHAAALPYLKTLALTPIPPETSDDVHSFSSAAEETILRTTAVEGVGALARRGNAEAYEALFEFLEMPSLSIRRTAVQELLATGKGRRARARIAEALPKDQRFLLDLKPADVRKVPQIEDPRRHLGAPARGRDMEAPPGLEGPVLPAERRGGPAPTGPPEGRAAKPRQRKGTSRRGGTAKRPRRKRT